MGESAITCPNCGARVALAEALTSQIETSVRHQYEVRARQQAKAMADKAAELQVERDKLEAREKTVDQEIKARLKVEEARLSELLSKQAEEAQAQKTEA